MFLQVDVFAMFFFHNLCQNDENLWMAIVCSVYAPAVNKWLDCICYREVRTKRTHWNFRKILIVWDVWATKWGMRLQYDAADKKTDKKIHASYNLEGTVLENVECIKYLGETFKNDLRWNSNICTKANRTLEFLCETYILVHSMYKKQLSKDWCTKSWGMTFLFDLNFIFVYMLITNKWYTYIYRHVTRYKMGFRRKSLVLCKLYPPGLGYPKCSSSRRTRKG